VYLDPADKQSKEPLGKDPQAKLPARFRTTLDLRHNETFVEALQGLLKKKQFHTFVERLTQALPEQRSAAFDSLAQEYYKGQHNIGIFAQLTAQDAKKLMSTLVQDISSTNITRSLCAGKFMHMFSQINVNSKNTFLNFIKKPGANPCHTLFSKYGIYHFARYELTHLKMALDESPLKRDEKLIVISYPNADWNGGFKSIPNFYPDQTFSNFFDTKRKSKVRLKICESGIQEQLAERLKNIHNKFGSADMMIIGGHGSKTNIELGDDRTQGQRGIFDNATITWGLRDDPRSLDISDSDILKTIASCTKPTGAIILKACSTGAGSDSIAQRLSSYFFGRVFAPDKDSYQPLIGIQDGKVFVDYNISSSNEPIKTNVFKIGNLCPKYYHGVTFKEEF
jgi:hypothetical protein